MPSLMLVHFNVENLRLITSSHKITTFVVLCLVLLFALHIGLGINTVQEQLEIFHSKSVCIAFLV